MQVNTQLSCLSSDITLAARENIAKCVHCGFCLATCPTYRVLNEEAHSPRGRIYNIKQLLAGEDITIHSLDTCLNCRACETTCPSGVEYHQILDLGKELIASKRSFWAKILRKSLAYFLTTPLLFNTGSLLIGRKAKLQYTLSNQTAMRMVLHTGCVQQPLLPDINIASYNILIKLGYEVERTHQAQCCGSVAWHLDSSAYARVQIEHNVRAWYAYIHRGAKAIISNASGCGLMIKEYPQILGESHPLYTQAQVVAQHTRDIGEFLLDEDLSVFHTEKVSIAYHEPCTLQHGQGLTGRIHQLLCTLGYDCVPIVDNHLCCGSAGTYSLFEQQMATTLRDNKLSHLGTPEVIVSSNIGCILHLQKGTHIPVKHWVELLH